jgi:hypothetical protein
MRHGVHATPSVHRPALWLDVSLKAALLGILLFAVAGPELEQFEGKAMAARAIVYPLAVAVVPVTWWLVSRRVPGGGRRRPLRARHPLDAPVSDPHGRERGRSLRHDRLVGRCEPLLQLGHPRGRVGQFLLRLPLGRLTTAGLAFGFGAVTAILGEFAEYVTFIRDSPELETAYTDTLGDLALGLAGSLVSASVSAALLWRRQRTS